MRRMMMGISRKIVKTTDFYQATAENVAPEIPNGVRNLVQNSSGNLGNINYWSNQSVIKSLSDDDGYYINYIKDLTSVTGRSFIENTSHYRKLSLAELNTSKFTISGHFRANNSNDIEIQFWVRYTNDASRYSANTGRVTIPADGEWHYLTATGKANKPVTEEEVKSYYPPLQIAITEGHAVDIDFKNTMLEIGSTDHEWVPAPEDLGWSTTLPAENSSKPYIWRYSYVEYDNESFETIGPNLM